MNQFKPEEVAVPHGHLIAGRPRDEGGAPLEVRRPSDGRVHGTVPLADDSVVDAAVRAAQAAFPQWRALAPRERGRVLRRWADLVDSHAEELARMESVVSARPAQEARAVDVPGVAEWLRFYGEYADKLDGAVTPTSPERLSLVLREPYGVVAVITPWNFPLFLAAWKIAPALAAGNTVVLKPSELTPWSIQRVAELALEAGLPEGALNIVHGNGPQTGAALVRHPGVAYVTFTGSTAVGAKIMADAAASGIKPVSLELGGKHPQLVFADCGDLDEVA
ncbi:MAG TPA: aldehyde dehydrogenase family protein, partial [Burkholderiales bacterium]|nr:aldehyde dehydrogenase family protein [Burkholderiales bacterium]